MPLAVLLLGSETRLSRTTSMAMAKSIAHYGIPLPSVWFLYSPGPSSHTTDHGNRVPPRTLRLHQRAFRLSTSSAPWPSARARKISQRYTLLNPLLAQPRQHHHHTLSAPLFPGCHKLELVRTSSNPSSTICVMFSNRKQISIAELGSLGSHSSPRKAWVIFIA